MKIFLIRLVGTIGLLYAGYTLISKQIIMPIAGTKTEGIVVGFKAKNASTPVDDNAGNRFFTARTPYVRFKPEESADSMTVLSDGNVFVGMLNYVKGDRVTVAYWRGKPQSATIIGWRQYPVMLLIGLAGWIFLFGKPPKGWA